MTTINKQQVSELILMETYADLHKVQDKIKFFEKKYNTPFENFEKIMNQEAENFEKYDDYIEWKAYLTQRQDLRQKINDIQNGNYKVA